MPYRDDFYIRANIVGYTADDGNILENPTLYFETETEHGRITQEHENPDNIGRGKVLNKLLFVLQGEECVLCEYKATNRRFEEVLKLHERYEARSGGVRGMETMRHKSRNERLSVTNLTEDQLDVLAQAIDLNPDLKRKERRNAADVATDGSNDPDDTYIPMGCFAFMDVR